MNQPRYKFPVTICPLCNKDLLQHSGMHGYNHVIWECTESVIPVDGSKPLTHYQVEWDKSTGTIAQHMIVGQFYLDTFNTDWRTRIHVARPSTYTYGPNNAADYITIVPQIHPDTSDKLLERVKILVLLS